MTENVSGRVGMGTGCFEELQKIVIIDVDRDHVFLVGMADQNAPHNLLSNKAVGRHGQPCLNASAATARCGVLQTERGTILMPRDEADYAAEWCIALAQEIVEAERAVIAGKSIPVSFTLTGEWVWERFRNLEAGLRSNGASRE